MKISWQKSNFFPKHNSEILCRNKSGIRVVLSVFSRSSSSRLLEQKCLICRVNVCRNWRATEWHFWIMKNESKGIVRKSIFLFPTNDKFLFVFCLLEKFCLQFKRCWCGNFEKIWNCLLNKNQPFSKNDFFRNNEKWILLQRKVALKTNAYIIFHVSQASNFHSFI